MTKLKWFPIEYNQFSAESSKRLKQLKNRKPDKKRKLIKLNDKQIKFLEKSMHDDSFASCHPKDVPSHLQQLIDYNLVFAFKYKFKDKSKELIEMKINLRGAMYLAGKKLYYIPRKKKKSQDVPSENGDKIRKNNKANKEFVDNIKKKSKKNKSNKKKAAPRRKKKA